VSASREHDCVFVNKTGIVNNLFIGRSEAMLEREGGAVVDVFFRSGRGGVRVLVEHRPMVYLLTIEGH